MSSERRDWSFYVRDMLHAIERIQARTAGRSLKQFAEDQDSIEIMAWNFHVLGEASTHIPAKITAAPRKSRGTTCAR